VEYTYNRLPLCGRPTNHGEPCRQWRVNSLADADGWMPLGCRFHLTDEERSRARKIEEAERERRRQAEVDADIKPVPWGALSDAERESISLLVSRFDQERQRLAMEPACWAWPIPEPREYANEEEAGRALADWQHGRGCAICGPGWDLVEDHDHQTGLVRGNLCVSCNVKEGWGDDTPPFEKYRLRNPASILGVQVRYWSAATGLAQPEQPSDLLTHEALRSATDRLTLPSAESLRDDIGSDQDLEAAP
jgi:hypothetical protein